MHIMVGRDVIFLNKSFEDEAILKNSAIVLLSTEKINFITTMDVIE